MGRKVMSGEFEIICECGAKLVVHSFPKCPKCGLSASLCDGCMPKHDCKDAKRREKAWDSLQNKD